jgi:hypothetical protein
LDSFNLTDHVKEATHISGNILDRIITRSESKLVSAVKVNEGISDHSAISFRINLPQNVNKVEYRTVRSWKKIDHDAFCRNVALEMYSVSKIVQPPASEHYVLSAESLLAHYDHSLRVVLDKMAPLTVRRQRRLLSSPWWNYDLVVMRRSVRQAEKKWRQSGLQVFRELLVEEKRNYHKMLLNARRQYLTNQLYENTANPRLTWKTLNLCLGRSETKILPSHPVLLDLANEFNVYFIDKVATVWSSLSSNLKILPLNPCLPASILPLDCFSPTTEREIRDIIMHSPRKPSQDDVIPLWLLIESLPVLLPAIVSIVNRVLIDGMPRSLKHSTITPLIKKKTLDPNSLASYRPVANSQTIAKVIERVVLCRLTSHLVLNKLQDKYQSAFKRHHSCETALLYVHDMVINAMDEGKIALLVLIDMSCAFDTVDHSILCKKLSMLGIQNHALSWLQNYLEDRHQSVRIGESVSSSCLVKYGVPQGSVLGPVLFSLYLTGIQDVLSKYGFTYALFADDIQLMVVSDPANVSAALIKLETCLNELIEWLNSHYLAVNSSKTEFLLLGTQKQIQKCPPNIQLTVGNSSIAPSASSVRNLGVWMDSCLNMSDHVNVCCRRAYSYMRVIGRAGRLLSLSNRLMLVKSLVFSQLDYGSVLLYHCSEKIVIRMMRIINAGMRLVFRLRKRDHITEHLKRHKVLSMKNRIKLRLLT